MKKIISTTKAPAAIGPYSQAVKAGPARSAVAVKTLPKGALVEIEVVALTD